MSMYRYTCIYWMCMYIPHYVMLLDIQMLESFYCTLLIKLYCTKIWFVPILWEWQCFNRSCISWVACDSDAVCVCVCVASSPCYYSGNATAATFIATKQWTLPQIMSPCSSWLLSAQLTWKMTEMWTSLKDSKVNICGT